MFKMRLGLLGHRLNHGLASVFETSADWDERQFSPRIQVKRRCILFLWNAAPFCSNNRDESIAYSFYQVYAITNIIMQVDVKIK